MFLESLLSEKNTKKLQKKNKKKATFPKKSCQDFEIESY